MSFHVSFQLTQQADLQGGWSENYWCGETVLANAAVKAKTLAGKLFDCHGNNTVIVKARVSTFPYSRVVQIVPIGLGAGTVTSATQSDYPTTAALLKLVAQNGARYTFQWMKGVYDSDVNDGGKWQPTASHSNAFNSLFAKLVSDGWCINVLDTTKAKQSVTAVSVAGIVTVPGHGFTGLTDVRISRARGTYLINALWQVSVVDSNNLQLVGYVAPTTPPVYQGGGKLQEQARAFLPITAPGTGPAPFPGCSVVRATSHRVGRPSGQLGGRRKKRKKAAGGQLVGP